MASGASVRMRRALTTRVWMHQAEAEHHHRQRLNMARRGERDGIASLRCQDYPDSASEMLGWWICLQHKTMKQRRIAVRGFRFVADRSLRSTAHRIPAMRSSCSACTNIPY
jgi:hypothetical protein